RKRLLIFSSSHHQVSSWSRRQTAQNRLIDAVTLNTSNCQATEACIHNDQELFYFQSLHPRDEVIHRDGVAVIVFAFIHQGQVTSLLASLYQADAMSRIVEKKSIVGLKLGSEVVLRILKHVGSHTRVRYRHNFIEALCIEKLLHLLDVRIRGREM